MAWVKTFRIVAGEFGVPDKEIAIWLSKLEKEAVLSIQTTFIPAIGKSDARLTVVATKLDEPFLEKKK